jgi:cobalt-precorrin 5A hydrolase
MNLLDLPLERIDLLATAEPKKHEKGIVETAKNLDIPLEIRPLNDLENFNHPDISDSAMVREIFGVAGICEPAALISAGSGSRLIFRKTAFNKVTVAVAVSRDS